MKNTKIRLSKLKLKNCKAQVEQSTNKFSSFLIKFNEKHKMSMRWVINIVGLQLVKFRTQHVWSKKKELVEVPYK